MHILCSGIGNHSVSTSLSQRDRTTPPSSALLLLRQHKSCDTIICELGTKAELADGLIQLGIAVDLSPKFL